MKASLIELGSRGIDRRTTVGRELPRWRLELIRDLGGPETLSTQRAALVDLVVREKLILDSIDAYLLELGGAIISRKRRSLLPVVRERAQLADSFTRRLVALGLERRIREAPDLANYIAERYGDSAGNGDRSPGGEAQSPESLQSPTDEVEGWAGADAPREGQDGDRLDPSSKLSEPAREESEASPRPDGGEP